MKALVIGLYGKQNAFKDILQFAVSELFSRHRGLLTSWFPKPNPLQASSILSSRYVIALRFRAVQIVVRFAAPTRRRAGHRVPHGRIGSWPRQKRFASTFEGKSRIANAPTFTAGRNPIRASFARRLNLH